MDELVSVAVMEPFSGQEDVFLEILHDLYTLLENKGYSRDLLLRSPADPPYYINVRRWKSAETRTEAQEDPDVHRCWARLGHVCKVVRVHQVMDEVDWKSIGQLQR